MTDPATESDRDHGKGRLFDWKKSGRYAWKSSFPLALVDRAGRAAPAPAPEATKSEAAAKPATLPSPAPKSPAT